VVVGCEKTSIPQFWNLDKVNGNRRWKQNIFPLQQDQYRHCISFLFQYDETNTKLDTIVIKIMRNKEANAALLNSKPMLP
jgi:hypothetical protein